MTPVRLGVLLVIVSGFALALSASHTAPPPTFSIPEYKAETTQSAPVIESALISQGLTREVHSATAVELTDGDIRVFWYGGTREGSKDTALFSRVLHQADNQWSDVETVMTRQRVTLDTRRYVRKLGNPVAMMNGDELWLFFVSVSVGGWAGSSINLTISEDGGNTWGSVRRLVTSPFLNISTLVRNTALHTDNGGMILPVYHQFLAKFGELLQLDREGNLAAKYRISHGREAIQPLLLAVDSSRAIALMRNASRTRPGNIWLSRNTGNLSDWSALEPLTLPNPDSAVAAVQLDTPDELLLVFNNHATERDDMAMAYSSDGSAEWKLIHEFEIAAEDEQEHNPYSYPFLLKTRAGDFHLFYTWRKSYIKHIHFNRPALQKMLSDAGSGT